MCILRSEAHRRREALYLECLRKSDVDKDNEDGDTCFQFNMTILTEDLTD